MKNSFHPQCCALCQLEKPLQESHLIPKFVSNWLKNTSATGHLRSIENPNRRVQDGVKDKLLCRDCEQLLSISEKHFAENVFVKFHQNEIISPDNNIFLHFIVSISWRLAYYYLNKYPEYYKFFATELRNAIEDWRIFLINFNHKFIYINHYLFSVVG